MDRTTPRLITLCKLWGIVEYFHPYLAYREIDWDGALVAAIPPVMAATDENSYADAVGAMLAVLGDPVTRVVRPTTRQGRPNGSPIPIVALREDGVLLVRFGEAKGRHTELWRSGPTVVEEKLPHAKSVVFDLRLPETPGAEWEVTDWLDSNIPKLVSCEGVLSPGERKRESLGFRSETNVPSGYYSAFVVRDGERFERVESARRLPVVFAVDRDCGVPRVALALQDAGRAGIVAGDGWSDESVVERHRFELEGGIHAEIRFGEVIRVDGSVGVCPDIVAPSSQGGSDVVLEAALSLARSFVPSRVKLNRAPAIGTARSGRAYPSMPYPTLEYRLLALFRAHCVIDYFFPYKDLMDEDWDAVLAAFIPRFQRAENALDYNLTVAELLTHTRDSHVSARSAVLQEYIGPAMPGIRLRWVEACVVISAFLDADVAGSSGMAVGDILLAVDGEDVEARMARLGRSIPASTPQGHRRVVLGQLPRGPTDSDARLRVRGADGQERTLSIRRSLAAATLNWPARDGEVVHWVSDGIGYADLDRLARSEVDGMFTMFAAAKAIIFDMRGYPRATAWLIAPRLAEKSAAVAARFERPRAIAPGMRIGDVTYPQGRDVFFQSIPPSVGPRYTGLTIMLIDERAISQAEHTGLFLKAANGTVFVGAPTTGANGDITSFLLPGGITAMFTGQAVTHPDGGRLQRVGLVPDVEAHPTIQGLREGRDEVLEAAIAYVERRGAD